MHESILLISHVKECFYHEDHKRNQLNLKIYGCSFNLSCYTQNNVSNRPLLLRIFSKRWSSTITLWRLQKIACYFWHSASVYLFAIAIKNKTIHTFCVSTGVEICLRIFNRDFAVEIFLPQLDGIIECRLCALGESRRIIYSCFGTIGSNYRYNAFLE